MLQRWDALIDFFKKENNNDGKQILEYLTNEAKLYFQFLMIFLKDVNAVNTLFQKREPLVTKIQEETTDIFNSTINLILLVSDVWVQIRSRSNSVQGLKFFV